MSSNEADQARNMSIMRMISATISIIASITMTVLIARSRTKFSTTQNRLLVGLAMSDIIASFSMAFASLPMPSDTPDVWLALGNNATCELQGFFYYFGGLMTPSYNVALCVFFLLKVRYDIADDTMSLRVEPFLHGFSILSSLIICVYCLIKDFFNPSSSVCSISDRPQGCSFIPNVPCERGEGYANDWLIRCVVIYLGLIVPFMIFSSMITLFITVLGQERRMANYGRGSLNLQPSAMSTRATQSRYVKMTLYRALAYSIAWLIPFAGVTYQLWQIMIAQTPPTPALQIFNSIFHPLQGFFNFIVYIYPKVLHERQANPEYSCCTAFTSALKINMSLPAWRRRRSHQSMVIRSENDIVNDTEEQNNEDFLSS